MPFPTTPHSFDAYPRKLLRIFAKPYKNYCLKAKYLDYFLPLVIRINIPF